MRITVLMLGLLLASTVRVSAQARSKDEAGIRSGVAAYEAAVNARDFPALAAVFTPDADLVFFDSPRLVGRDAIRKSHSDGISEWPASRKFSLEVTSIRFLRPELALIETIGRFSQGEMRSNRGTIVAARHDGRWQWAALRVYPAQSD
jgi:uncharacterized protein (TIGR02246 family)